MTARKNTNRQHHVAQFYLRAWASPKRLFVLQDGTVRKAAVKDVAVQNRFYKLRELTPRDEEFVRLWISVLPQHSHESHLRTLAVLTLPFRMKRQLSEVNRKYPEIDEHFQQWIINQQESWHSNIEDGAAPLLKRLQSGDLSFFENKDDCILFYLFLPLQLFRTKASKDQIIARIEAAAPEVISGVNIDNCWIALTEIMAHTVGGSLFFQRDRRRPVVVQNNTGVPFITGDQPVLNIARQPGEEVEHLMLYYPLSPTTAFILTEIDGVSPYFSDTLTEADVHYLNERMAQNSYMQVFGDSAAALQPYAGGEG